MKSKKTNLVRNKDLSLTASPIFQPNIGDLMEVDVI